MAPMKSMKAMKAMKASSNVMTATAAYTSVAETCGLKTKDVRAVMEGIVAVAAEQLKKKPARPARKGVNPFTKEPCVFKAKPASKTVRALPMKKLKEMIN